MDPNNSQPGQGDDSPPQGQPSMGYGSYPPPSQPQTPPTPVPDNPPAPASSEQVAYQAPPPEPHPPATPQTAPPQVPQSPAPEPVPQPFQSPPAAALPAEPAPAPAVNYANVPSTGGSKLKWVIITLVALVVVVLIVALVRAIVLRGQQPVETSAPASQSTEINNTTAPTAAPSTSGFPTGGSSGSGQSTTP